MSENLLPFIAWTELLGTNDTDYATGLTTGIDDSIYISGSTRGILDDGQINRGGSDAFLTKYRADGSKIWTRLWGTTSDEIASALITGIDGSIYITGSTRGGLDGQTNSGGSDAFVTKYSTNGVKEWTRLWGTSDYEEGRALSISADGSIYITGSTRGGLDGQTNSGGFDSFITKYRVDGTKVWTRQWGTSDYEEAAAISIGADGSVYIAGSTRGNLDGQINRGSSDAFLTKYTSNGVKLWTKQWGSSDSDTTRGLTIGPDGSIYIAGSTRGGLDGQNNSGGSDSFITKYTSDGVQLWTRQWGTSSDEVTNTIITGSDGSIYLGGYTTGNLDGQNNSGGSDGWISKYQPDGSKIWTKLLGTATDDGISGVTVGSDDSLYVGGYTTGNLNQKSNSGRSDAFLTKLTVDDNTVANLVINTIARDDVVDPAEAQAGFSITGTGEPGATVTLVFDSGRVLNAGNTAVVAPNGTWAINVVTADVAGFGEGLELVTGTQTDINGNVSRAVSKSFTNTNNLTAIAITPSQILQPEGNSGTTAFTFTVNRSGNIRGSNTVNWAISGSGSNPATVDDFKFGDTFPSGNITFRPEETSKTITINVMGDSRTELDETFAVVVFNGGTATITTDTANATIQNDDVVPSLDWIKLLGSPEDDFALAMDTSSAGSIYIAGTTNGNLDGRTRTGLTDSFITKYNPNGTKVGTVLQGTSSLDYVNSIVVGSEELYVSGYTLGTRWDGQRNNGGYDAFITKYDLDGVIIWTQLLGTASFDYSNAIATDSNGNIYIAGRTQGSPDGQQNTGGYDVFLTKYTPDGTKEWTRMLGSTGDDSAHAIAVGADDYIYITGITNGNLDGQTNNGASDAFIAKYTSDGTKFWTRLLGGTSFDQANAITIGNDQNIYIGGRTGNNLDGQSNNGASDAFIAKYTSDGIKDWTRLLGSTNFDEVTALTTGENGYIYATGPTRGILDGQTNTGGSDSFVTKYNPNGTKIWTTVLGGSRDDQANGIIVDENESIYISGNTYGDITQQKNAGLRDAFITKLKIIPILGVSPANASQLEGNAGVRSAAFTVNRIASTSSTSSVNWSVRGSGSNPATADDFGGIFPSGTVSFAPGETSKQINVSFRGDTTIEGDETFTVTLSDANGATIGTATASGAILNDDQTQEIYSEDGLTVIPDGNLTVPLFYSTSNNDNTVTGIGVRLHYNSEDLTFIETSNFFGANIFSELSNESDTNNLDNDPNTDRYLEFQYADYSGNWPNQPLPLKLGDFKFKSSITFEGTRLNITSDNLAPNYFLETDPILVTKQQWNLDIDGNGRVEALSDGIMVVRSMFGDAFIGNELINGAITSDASRDLQGVQAHLQIGVDTGYLDIDGNGKIEALSDGVMIVRHMFGFAGDRLIQGAIAPDATRDLLQIEELLTELTTLV